MPVEGAARAPYSVQVSCKVAFNLSPLTVNDLEAIAVQSRLF
jgi:hypothetical protein